MAEKYGEDKTDAIGFGLVKTVKQVLKIVGLDDPVEDDQVYKKKARTTREQLLSDTYKMDHPRRGKALIFNNKIFATRLQRLGYTERRGTDVDSSSLCKRLQLLGFQVDKQQDATAKEMVQILDQYANEDHSDADCFVCVFLSHGETDFVFGHDDKVQLADVFQKFDAIHCPSLIGKPKIFIIQACRGQQFDKGESVPVARNVTDAKRDFDTAFPEEETISIPNDADFLVAQSTIPGYFSWRNSQNGSWFIQALVKALDKYGTTVDILRLLTYVNKEVAYGFESNTGDLFTTSMKQVPAFTSRLTKDLYFHPKN